MKLITKAIEKQLIANTTKLDTSANKPILKLFGGSACTWLISEMNGDELFGLCDLGMGYPEVGYVMLSELEAIKFAPFGLPVERDKGFKADKTLTEYTDEAREHGRIVS